MNLTFQQQLNVELLRSERRRTIIIISIFLFAMGYRIVDTFLFKMDEETQRIQSSCSIWVFPLAIILFELFSLLYITRRLRRNRKKIPMLLQFLNTGFEICLPSFIILSVARQFPLYDVLKSPVLYIYFIFIILSTLRLNFALSFFCGLLASASYVAFRLSLDGQFNSNDAGRALIILLSGVAAGLVANQIKAGINNSVKEAERRHKVENLFGQQISTEVAEKMLENDGMIESKRMMVAIMFIDIRNFSRFAAGLNPEEIVHFQNAFFSIVINTVTKHDGIVNQILGDGCMVTFGAPLPLQNPSQKAFNAALEMLDQLDSAIDKGELVPTRIGIGIHTGEVVTGNIGTDTRQQYSITGSVVIMASRIEQLNKEFHSQMLVSEDVIRAIDCKGITTELYSDISLKGFEEPVSIYKVA